MAVIKCKMCGGDLRFAENANVAECEYCGSKQTIPNQDSEKKLTLFARADRLRRACEFDKAAGVYESIVGDFPAEAEAYWGLVLCRYGIEYVDDPTTGKKVPTCHRSSFDSILEDADFDQACENADPIARRLYRDEAKAIENIRKGILEVSGKEEPYDIFICYKETDESGSRTIDSVIAQDVYDALTEKGYRAFFSRISLEDKLGTEYEPYIFAALNSAKIMLVFGTDFEYFNAVWVKNEWSRFLKLMAQDKNKHLIPCYKNLDAYDMPKEFAKLQAQDMGKVGAMQDLLRGIGKILKGKTNHTKSSSIEIESQLQVQTKTQADNLVRLGTMSLNAGDIEKGIQQFEEAIRIDSNHIGAYIGLVRAVSKDKCGPYYRQLKTYPVEEVETWLKENPDMLDDSNLSLLLIDKIITNTESIVLTKAVLDAGEKLNGQYTLYYAIKSENRVALTKLLLSAGANSNRDYQLSFSDSIEMRSPLADAIWQAKDFEVAKLLIENGADVNYSVKSDTGSHWSLLDFAVRINDLSIVRLLLENGADPNVICETQYTKQTRHMGVSGSNGWTSTDRAKYLYTPIISAVWNVKSYDIVKAMIEYHADVNFVVDDMYFLTNEWYPNSSYSVLDTAIRANDASIVKLILKNGGNPDQGYNGLVEVRPPLATAILFSSDFEIFEFLIESGANMDVVYETTKYGDDGYSEYKQHYSLIDLANQNQNQKVINLLHNNRRIKQLKAERDSLQYKLSGLNGLFADSRRKKIETRILEIKNELSMLEADSHV